jgi:hypothetical protein
VTVSWHRNHLRLHRRRPHRWEEAAADVTYDGRFWFPNRRIFPGDPGTAW